jgi:hypothetical protein
MNWLYADTDAMTKLGTKWTADLVDRIEDAAREIAATEHLSMSYFTVLSMGLAPAVVEAENYLERELQGKIRDAEAFRDTILRNVDDYRNADDKSNVEKGPR